MQRNSKDMDLSEQYSARARSTMPRIELSFNRQHLGNQSAMNHRG